MILYLVLSLFLAILTFCAAFNQRVFADCTASYIPPRHKSKNRISFLYIVSALLFAVLFVLTAFRSIRIGNDTAMYVYWYNKTILDINYPQLFEIGYRVYCFLLGKLGLDEHGFIIITAIVSYLPLLLLIFRKSINPCVTIILFACIFFSLYTNILRQGIAMVIITYSYFFLKRRKYFLFILFVVFASLFHISSLVCFVLLAYKIVPKRFLPCFFIVLVCLLLSASGSLNYILAKLLPSYGKYFESEYSGRGWFAVSFYLLRGIFLLALSSIVLKKHDAGEDFSFVHALFFFLTLCICFGYSVNLFVRGGEYFLLIGIVELPLVLKKIKYSRTILVTFCLISIAFFLLVLIFRPEWNRLIPYEFWSE